MMITFPTHLYSLCVLKYGYTVSKARQDANFTTLLLAKKRGKTATKSILKIGRMGESRGIKWLMNN